MLSCTGCWGCASWSYISTFNSHCKVLKEWKPIWKWWVEVRPLCSDQDGAIMSPSCGRGWAFKEREWHLKTQMCDPCPLHCVIPPVNSAFCHQERADRCGTLSLQICELNKLLFLYKLPSLEYFVIAMENRFRGLHDCSFSSAALAWGGGVVSWPNMPPSGFLP